MDFIIISTLIITVISAFVGLFFKYIIKMEI